MKITFNLFLISLFISSAVFAQKSKLEIVNAWARPATQGANSALYFTIVNKGENPDTLIGAESKAADIVEIHETYKKDNDRMGMRPVKFVAVNTKSSAEFKPGGLHIMMLDMQRDFKMGNRLEAILQFKKAGKIKVEAEIKDSPGMKMMH